MISMKSTIEEGAVKYKLKEEDRKKILDQVTSWLEKNQGAEKEEFEDKLKELEKVCMPLMTKVYQGGGSGAPGGAPRAPGAAGETRGGGGVPGGGSKAGPTIEEVDWVR